MFTQLLHVEQGSTGSARQTKVGFKRQTVFKAEADAMHRNGVVVVLQKQVGNALSAPPRNVRRIDDVIGDLFDPGAASRAQTHGLFKTTITSEKRVLTARLLKNGWRARTPDASINKILYGLFCAFNCFERAEKRLKKARRRGYRDDRYAALNTLGFIKRS